MLRLFLIWRLQRFAGPLIAIALALTAVMLGAHALASGGRQFHHQADNTIRGLQRTVGTARKDLERALAVALEPGGGR